MAELEDVLRKWWAAMDANGNRTGDSFTVFYQTVSAVEFAVAMEKAQACVIKIRQYLRVEAME